MPFDPDAKYQRQPALSIRQPWAELILSGRKTIELRTWSTDYRGPLWVHTGLKADPDLERRFGLEALFHGGFVGQVLVSSIVRLDPYRWQRWRERHLSEGSMPDKTYGWVLQEPIRLAYPIPAAGELGLFEPSAELVEILHNALWEGDRTHGRA